MTSLKAFVYGVEINKESNGVKFSDRHRDKRFIYDLMNRNLNLT